MPALLVAAVLPVGHSQRCALGSSSGAGRCRWQTLVLGLSAGAPSPGWGAGGGAGGLTGVVPRRQALEAERLKNFQQLLQLEEEVLVPNREVLECRICYQRVAPGEGVLLRECLHNFCR